MDAVSSVDPAEASATPEASVPNLVTIACPCLGTPHAEDTITLALEVPLPLGISASMVISRATDEVTTMGELSPLFLRFGVVAWTLVDAEGEPERLTPENIERRLSYGSGGFEVANAAAGLYTGPLMRPLLAARQRSSQPGQTAASTPPMNGSGRRHQRRSGQSSPRPTAGQPSTP